MGETWRNIEINKRSPVFNSEGVSVSVPQSLKSEIFIETPLIPERGSLTGLIFGVAASLSGALLITNQLIPGSVSGALALASGSLENLTQSVSGEVSGVPANVNGSVGTLTIGQTFLTGNVEGSLLRLIPGEVLGSGSVNGSILAQSTGQISGALATIAGTFVEPATGEIVGEIDGILPELDGALENTTALITGSVLSPTNFVSGQLFSNVAGLIQPPATQVFGEVEDTTVSLDGLINGILADCQGEVEDTTQSIAGEITQPTSEINGSFGVLAPGDISGVISGAIAQISGEIENTTQTITGELIGDSSAISGELKGVLIGVITQSQSSVSGSILEFLAGAITSPASSVSGNLYSLLSGAVIGILGEIDGILSDETLSISGDIDQPASTVSGSILEPVIGSVLGVNGSLDGIFARNLSGEILGIVSSANGAVREPLQGSIDGVESSVSGDLLATTSGTVTEVIASTSGGLLEQIPGSITAAASSVSGSTSEPILGELTNPLAQVSGNLSSSTSGSVTQASSSVDGVFQSASTTTEITGTITGVLGSVSGSLLREWTPNDISSQIASWFDADDAASFTITSSRVAQWNDKSGNARHATNPNANTTRPVRTTNLQNGRAGVQFTGSSSQFLVWTYNAFFEGFVVCKATAPTGSGYDGVVSSISSTSFAGGPYGVFLYWDGSEEVTMNAATATYSEYAETGIPRDVNVPLAVYFRKTANQIQIGVGDQSASDSINTIAPVSRHFIGADNYFASGSTPTSNFLTGDVYEVIYANTLLSTDNFDRIWGYLHHKWGITSLLPSDHPYKTAKPMI